MQPGGTINAHLNDDFLLEFEPVPQKQLPSVRHKIIEMPSKPFQRTRKILIIQ
jgi:hypothetical protein